MFSIHFICRSKVLDDILIFTDLNAGEHGEAPGADQSEAEGDDEADPEPDGHQLPALPHRPELAAPHLEHLPQVKY